MSDLADGPVRLLWAAGARLGEGALWDDQAQCLWWVDIRGARLHRMDAAGEARRSWNLPQPAGCVALTEEPSRLLLGLREGVFAFTPGSGALEFLAAPEGHRAATHRLNDGKVDPAGRFWFGTMQDAEQAAEGALHRLEAPGRRMDGPYTVPNGPAFSPDGRVMYCADSPTRIVHAFALDSGGEVTGKREFLRFAEAEGYPDGMTVDAEGCLWVAHWDGGCVSRFAPDGRRLGQLAVPTPKVTSCAFGGPEMRTLFLTTAGGSGTPEAGEAAGGVFAARTTVAGLPAGRARLEPMPAAPA